MATTEATLLVGMDIRSLVRPNAPSNAEDRDAFERRCRALEAVAGGSSFRSAAHQCAVDPRTVRKDAELAVCPGPDGTMLGFRACLPFRRQVRARASRRDPTKGYAHAMTGLIASDPRLQRLVDDYSGGLPTGHRKNRRFDRHLSEFKRLVREIHGETAYPLRRSDGGRRALLEYHKNERRRRQDAGAPEVEETVRPILRLGDVMPDEPLERLEFDAHKIDLDARLLVPNPAGGLIEKVVPTITLLVLVCAATRYVVSHLLVMGAYNRIDVLRLLRRAMVPWQPRALLVPGLQYLDGARLGLPLRGNAMPRGIVIAGDNAMAHHAKIALHSIARHYRGILHLGESRSPDGRPIVEALFRRLEQGALRKLPGAYQPEADGRGKAKTNYARPQDHPLHWPALLDLVEVICANHNVSPHNGLRGQTPVAALDAHLASGWCWETSEWQQDAQAMTTIRKRKLIRGRGKTGHCPFVEYEGAYYRSPKLMGARSRVGTTMFADIDVADLRSIVLVDDEGAPWSRLTALPPWDRTAHDLHLRQQINRTRDRGLLNLAGSDDAVQAYTDFTLKCALANTTPVDAYARAQAQLAPPAAIPAIAPPGFRFEPQPRFGRTSFATRKD